ncbi:MAG: hypothetical protein ABL921_27815 [Pirellula sp.]
MCSTSHLLSKDFIIFSMRTDPKPDYRVAIHHAKSTVADTNSNRECRWISYNLFEM